MTLEAAYLEHILLHLRSKDADDRPLRTYLDSWYAYKVGVGLMEKNICRPQWLNRGDLEKRPELSRYCHALSVEAESRIKVGMVSDLTKDHSVPLKQLILELAAQTWGDRDELRAFLLRCYRVAVITQAEHRRLGRGDAARRKAGVILTEEDGPFARYDCPEWGIEYRELR